jgi:hypothetical protein
MKPVKAFAVVDRDGPTASLDVFADRHRADEYCIDGHQRVVPGYFVAAEEWERLHDLVTRALAEPRDTGELVEAATILESVQSAQQVGGE